jgi:cation diffusion facilitator family transporter
MKKFTRWLAAKAIKNHQNVNDLKVRSHYGTLEGWTSIVINLLLFVVKIALGLSIRSVSLIADAVHTLADSGTSAVVIIGFKIARKPSDKEHPFGHGRMESIAALVVSVLLFMAGLELLEKSIHAIIKPQNSTAPTGVILVIIATIVIKELMARFSYQLGEIIDSQALKADALHHRSDVIATALVVVALIATRFGYNNIDGIMGVGVSLIIFYSAFSIAKEAVNPLLGEAPSKETIKEIEKLAMAHEGVLGVHDIIFHKYGQTSVISLHIEVLDNESAFKLHDLAERVEDTITQKIPGMAVVHVDPLNKDHPQYEQINRAVKDIISEDIRVSDFHDLRIVGCRANRCNVVFDIVLEQDADEQETHDIIHSIAEKFKTKFPEMKTVIKAEPKYAYNL